MQVRPSSVPPKSILKNGPLYKAQSQASSSRSLFGSVNPRSQVQSPFPTANFVPSQQRTPYLLSQSANNPLNSLYSPPTTPSNMSAVSFAPYYGSFASPGSMFSPPRDLFAPPSAPSLDTYFAMPSTPSSAPGNAYSTFSLPQPSGAMYKDPATTTATTADQTGRQAAVRAMVDGVSYERRVQAGPDGRTVTVIQPLDVDSRAIAELLGARGADGKRFTTGATRTATESTPSTGSRWNPLNWISPSRSSAASGTGTRPTEAEEKEAARQSLLTVADVEDLAKLAYQTGAQDTAKSQVASSSFGGTIPNTSTASGATVPNTLSTSQQALSSVPLVHSATPSTGSQAQTSAGGVQAMGKDMYSVWEDKDGCIHASIKQPPGPGTHGLSAQTTNNRLSVTITYKPIDGTQSNVTMTGAGSAVGSQSFVPTSQTGTNPFSPPGPRNGPRPETQRYWQEVASRGMPPRQHLRAVLNADDGLKSYLSLGGILDVDTQSGFSAARDRFNTLMYYQESIKKHFECTDAELLELSALANELHDHGQTRDQIVSTIESEAAAVNVRRRPDTSATGSAADPSLIMTDIAAAHREKAQSVKKRFDGDLSQAAKWHKLWDDTDRTSTIHKKQYSQNWISMGGELSATQDPTTGRDLTQSEKLRNWELSRYREKTATEIANELRSKWIVTEDQAWLAASKYVDDLAFSEPWKAQSAGTDMDNYIHSVRTTTWGESLRGKANGPTTSHTTPSTVPSTGP